MSSPSRKSSTINIPHLYVSFRASSAHPFGLLIDFTNHNTDQWLLVMSTQLIGFSIGGICKRFVVTPPTMIWPETLLTAVLFNTLHDHGTLSTQARGGISRQRFFSYVFIGYIFYSQFFLFSFVLRSYFIIIPRLLAVLSLHCSLELFIGLLDSSKQCQSQPAVWGRPRFGHGYFHL